MIHLLLVEKNETGEPICYLESASLRNIWKEAWTLVRQIGIKRVCFEAYADIDGQWFSLVGNRRAENLNICLNVTLNRRSNSCG